MKIKHMFILLAASVSTASCGFLDEYDPNATTVGNFYKSEADIVTSLNGVYASLTQSYYYTNNHYFTDVRSHDTAVTDSGANSGIPYQFYNYTLTEENSYVYNRYTQLFKTISRANTLLAHLDDVSYSNGDARNTYEAEIRFLRALTYFHLVTEWGDVPLILTELKTKDEVQANNYRRPKSEVYKAVFADLDYVLGSPLADMQPALQSAEHSIFVESFFIGMGEMWGQIHEILRRKAAAGLDVRVIYDDAGCLSLRPHNYAELLRAEGIRAFSFNRCVPVLNLVMNNRDHRKIMVIDGQIAFTGGVNLADEYINKIVRFGYWKDSGVRLDGPGAASLANIFLTFWKAKYPDEDLDAGCDLPAAVPVETDCLVQPFADTPVDREAVAKNVYLELINQAQKRLYICTPYLILDNDLLSCLRLAAKRGVDVRIYTPGVPDKPTIYQLTRSYFPHLLRAGVKIYSYTPGFLHAKTWLVDDRIAAVGTVNLDYRSLYLHFENSVLLYGGAVLDDVRRDLAEIEKESAEVKLADCRTGFFGTMYSAVLRLVAPLC